MIIGDDGICAYLFLPIRNSVYKHWRRKKRVAVGLLEKIEDNSRFVQASDYDHGAGELKSLYEEKLNLLSPQRQQVFGLSREENPSYSEIANQLPPSINTAREHISASLQHFRDHLKDVAMAIFPLFYLF